MPAHHPTPKKGEPAEGMFRLQASALREAVLNPSSTSASFGRRRSCCDRAVDPAYQCRQGLQYYLWCLHSQRSTRPGTRIVRPSRAYNAFVVVVRAHCALLKTDTVPTSCDSLGNPLQGSRATKGDEFFTGFLQPNRPLLEGNNKDEFGVLCDSLSGACRARTKGLPV